MGTGIDFLNCLNQDMSIKILMFLEDPTDLARTSSVSRSWRHFVIVNGLCKHLCLKLFPQLSGVDHVTEPSGSRRRPHQDRSRTTTECKTLETEHRAYAFLAHGAMSFPVRDCILEAMVASSTDNFPEESIDNTLEPRDRVAHRASYWSSSGQSDPSVPETLIYKLASNFSVITEIDIQPFQAYFQPGLPIYSARSVRFRMGHPKPLPENFMDTPPDDSTDNAFCWTYTSREFPMSQENSLQIFQLPEPVLCIGGILQIELLGRVQRQEMDGLFYICVARVQVLGRPLSPAFDVEILEDSGKFVLKVLDYTQPISSEESNLSPHLQRGSRNLEQIVNMLWENAVDVVDYGWNEEEDDLL